MKKFICILLLISLTLPFSACGKNNVRDVDCTDIISAYENEGYCVTHTQHCNEEGYPYRCYIVVQLCKEDKPSDDLYITTYWTEEEATKAAKTDQYNGVIWFYALVNGEHRWLKTGTYGTIAYGTYNRKMLKPLKTLIK